MTTPAKSNASPKIKDNKLQQAVHGFKLINLRKNLAEIASVAGISERTAQNHKEEIDVYWSEKNMTPDDDKKFFLERSIELGIDNVSKNTESMPEHILGVMLGAYLKVETDLLDEARSMKKVWTIGQYIANIHNMVCRYKNQGAPIHSDYVLSAKYLLQPKNMNLLSLDKLFIRSDDYRIGQQSKRWASTELLKKYIEVCCDKFLAMTSNPVSYLPHLWLQKGATQGADKKSPLCNNNNNNNNNNSSSNNNNNNIYDDSKSCFFRVDVNYIYTMLIAKRNIIEKLEPNSKFSLLTQAVKFTDDDIFIPIKHKAKSNEHIGRTYNVFCNLHAYERKMLGYIGYDMSAAMQSISLHLIKASKSDYPMLWKYVNNKQYKKAIREEIATDLGITKEKVKETLSAFANGLLYGKDSHKHYQVFQKESERLRKEVLKYVRENDPKVLERAIEQSRKAKHLPEELDLSDIEREETPEKMRRKASLYFFVWTHYERQIRQAMLDVLEDGIEVHDAVYSQMDIDEKLVEKAIYAQTRYNITIEKDK